MEKCCQAIEKYGMRSQGIYRINGTQRKVTILKEKLDKGTIEVSNVSLTDTDIYCDSQTSIQWISTPMIGLRTSITSRVLSKRGSGNCQIHY